VSHPLFLSFPVDCNFIRSPKTKGQLAEESQVPESKLTHWSSEGTRLLFVAAAGMSCLTIMNFEPKVIFRLSVYTAYFGLFGHEDSNHPHKIKL
jgi:hypothetical protein